MHLDSFVIFVAEIFEIFAGSRAAMAALARTLAEIAVTFGVQISLALTMTNGEAK